MSTSINRFVELYEQIMRIELIESNTELNSLIATFTSDNLSSMKQMITVSGMAMTERELIATML